MAVAGVAGAGVAGAGVAGMVDLAGGVVAMTVTITMWCKLQDGSDLWGGGNM